MAPAVEELGLDDEMREVFLEEAGEVLEGARTALAGLGHEPADPQRIATLRRAFHTLKGSSRMVGLREFGAAAWACEQVYNNRLAEQRPADPPLLEFTSRALAELANWVDAIARSLPVDAFQASSLQAAAEALEASSSDRARPPKKPAPRLPARARSWPSRPTCPARKTSNSDPSLDPNRWRRRPMRSRRRSTRVN